ncbi:hypothetical protein AGMMS49525_05340 [Bacteroidia bacterium]|nr:hypothetical protein AGMMS49525_05340 [Bacteroidia bacterium]
MAAVALLTACNGGSGGRKHGKSPAGSNAPTDSVAAVSYVTPAAVNVYIENSGSMDGYVKGVTEFEQAVYNYLSDIKISAITDTLNLYYINSQVIPQGSDIGDFIEKLEPSNFRAKGGNRGTSDIANVLETVLKETKAGKVAILVTDGIFSPGKGKDAEQYLVNQQIGIKRLFADYLKTNKTAAVMVYQLQSKFSGTYYNNVDASIPLNENRPFYIWVIGDVKHLCNLRGQIADDKLKARSAAQNLNIFTTMNGCQTVKYAINPSIGKFKKSKTDNKTIANLKKDSRTGKVKFAVNVDFSGMLLDESYLLDPNNYENSSKYDLEIKKSATTGGGYTHVLYFTSDRVYAGAITVKLKADMPAWVEAANDDAGTTAVKNKTYGIKYQLGGVYDAFTFTNRYYTEIKINVN